MLECHIIDSYRHIANKHYQQLGVRWRSVVTAAGPSQVQLHTAHDNKKLRPTTSTTRMIAMLALWQVTVLPTRLRPTPPRHRVAAADRLPPSDHPPPLVPPPISVRAAWRVGLSIVTRHGDSHLSYSPSCSMTGSCSLRSRLD